MAGTRRDESPDSDAQREAARRRAIEEGETLPAEPRRQADADATLEAGDLRAPIEPPRAPPRAGLRPLDIRGESPGIGRIAHYRLVRELGRGGQGIVWLAEDLRLGRRVALKVISPQFAPTRGTLARFQREAAAASRIDHPGICAIYEAGEADGYHFIAMRYVEGRSLADLIESALAGRTSGVIPARGAETAGTLAEHVHKSAPVEGEAAAAAQLQPTVSTRRTPSTRDEIFRILQLIERVARALHVAHEAGLIHRDIKPANILVTPDGEPVVLDFGLVREEDEESHGLTVSGDLLGTPAYMSPEQVAAHRIALDRRTDIYSLGVTLYESLTLVRPFDAPTRDGVYQKILTGNPKNPSKINRHISRDLDIVVSTALEKDRDRRYKTALDFAEDLRRVRTFEPIQARPAGVILRSKRWVQRNPVLATALFLLSVGLISSLFLLDRARFERDRADQLLGQLESTNEELRTALDAEASARRTAEEESAAKEVALGKEREARELLDNQSEELKRALEDVAAERDRAQSLYLVGQASSVLGSSPSQALLLASEAATRAPGRLANDVLIEALARHHEHRVFSGHGGMIRDLAADPMGRYLAAVSETGEVSLWNLESRERQVILFDPSDERLMNAVFAPNGETLATASTAGDVHVWTIPDGRLRFSLGEHRPGIEITSMSFDASGERLIATTQTGKARVWRIDDGSEVLLIENSSSGIASARFSPDGTKIVIASSGSKTEISYDEEGRRTGSSTKSVESSSARIYDSTNGAELFAAREFFGELTAAWSADGSRLLVASPTRVSLFDSGQGEEILPARLRALGHGLTVGFLDGGLFWSQTRSGGDVQFWSAIDGTLAHSIGEISGGVPVAVSKDLDHILGVLKEDERQLGVFRISTGERVRTLAGHEGPVTALAFIPGGELCASGSTDGTVRVWSLGPRPVGELLSVDGLLIREARFVANGRRLVLSRFERADVLATPSGQHVGLLLRSDPRGGWWPFSRNPVFAATWTPAGKILGALRSGSVIAWSKDGTSIESSTPVVRPRGFDLSTDGDLILFSHGHPTPAVDIFRDEGTGLRRVGTWRSEAGAVIDPRFLGDRRNVAFALFARQTAEIRTYDVETGEEARLLELPGELVSPEPERIRTFTDRGRSFLVVASPGKPMVGIDLRSATRVAVGAAFPSGGLVRVADGGERILVVAGGSVAILARDGDTFRRAAHVGSSSRSGDRPQGRSGAIATAAFLPGDDLVIALRESGAIELLDVETGSTKAVFEGDDFGPATAFDVSPDGERLVVVGVGNKARIRRLSDGIGLQDLEHPDRPYIALFSPDGERVLTSCRDGIARVFDAQSGRMIRALERTKFDFGGEPQTIEADRVVPATNGERIARVDAADARLRVIEVESDRVLFETDWVNNSHRGPVAVDHRGTRVALAVSLEAPSRFARLGELRLEDFVGRTGGIVSRVRPLPVVYDAETQRLLRVLPELDDEPREIILSADGRLVAVSSWTSLGVWDVESGARILERRELGELPIAFHPDGRSLLLTVRSSARALAYRAAAVVELESGVLRLCGDAEADATAFAFSPDGKTIAVGSTDRALRLFDADTLELEATLRGHGGAVTHIVFSADGRFIATAGEDRAIRVWETASQREWLTFAQVEPMADLAFCEGEGLLLACTVGSEWRTWMWPLDPLATARSLLSRELTYEERERFQIGTDEERSEVRADEVVDSFCDRFRSVLRFHGANPDLPISRQILDRESRVVRLGPLRQAAGDGAPVEQRFLERMRAILEEVSVQEEPIVELRAEIEATAGDESRAISILESLAGTDSDLPATIRSRLEQYRAAARPDLPTFRTIDAALAESETLVPRGAMWRYFRGVTHPSPATEWTRVEFDDSSWPVGPSGFGYGDGDDATVLEDMRGSYTTVYARHTFEIDDPGRFRSLRLRVFVDDGCVAWVNGEEVGRSRAPRAPTHVPHDGTATSYAPDPGEWVAFEIAPSVLERGVNVVAIHGLNHTVDSSDLSLIPILEAEPAFDPERIEARLSGFRTSARGLGAPLRIAYLDARLLELAGRHTDAHARFLEIARSAPGISEIQLALVRTEQATGRSREALRRLRPLLEGGATSDAAWRLWFDRFYNVEDGDSRALLEFLSSFSIDRLPAHAREIRASLELFVAEGAVRIACGATEDVMDAEGARWVADRFYVGGRAGGQLDGIDIQGTEDDELYRIERYFGSQARPQGFGYRVPLRPGEYVVELRFLEIFHNEPGARSFDVLLEGRPVLEAFDPFREGGGRFVAVPRSFTLRVTDGSLDLAFVPRVGDPQIAAISIRRAD